MTVQPSTTAQTLEWRWKFFSDLTPIEVYDMLAARSEVFVVEQNCVYGDVDGRDINAWHLFAYSANGILAGYLRVLPPSEKEPDICIGRVLTTSGFRGIGLGRLMLERTLTHIAEQWPRMTISLHAQARLQCFYGAFGFTPSSDIHDEDGIPHIWMRSG